MTLSKPKIQEETDNDDDKKSTDSMPGLISLTDEAQVGPSAGLAPLPVVPYLLEPVEMPAQNIMPVEVLGETLADAVAEAPAN